MVTFLPLVRRALKIATASNNEPPGLLIETSMLGSVRAFRSRMKSRAETPHMPISSWIDSRATELSAEAVMVYQVRMERLFTIWAHSGLGKPLLSSSYISQTLNGHGTGALSVFRIYQFFSQVSCAASMPQPSSAIKHSAHFAENQNGSAISRRMIDSGFANGRPPQLYHFSMLNSP